MFSLSEEENANENRTKQKTDGYDTQGSEKTIHASA